MDRLFRLTAILIPAVNASRTIPRLFARLWKFVEPAQVIVVDDGSEDDTAEVCSMHGVHVFRHHRNLGKGKALQTGFDAFLQTEFSFVATIDADLQHAPENLPSFVEVQRLSGADIVVGKRRIFGVGMPPHRMLSNILTSKLVSLRTGLHIPDSQCGYRLVARQAIEAITLESSGYEAETEFLIKAAKKGFRVEAVPIETIYAGEKSSMKNWDTTFKFIKVLMQEY